MNYKNLWERFLEEFRSAILNTSEEKLSSAWSSPKARTAFYKEMLIPLAKNLGSSIEEELEAGNELFKVDFAICRNSNGIEIPLIFIESENNPFDAEHEIRKLVNLAAPLRVLVTVVQWDEETGIREKAYRSALLPSWEKIISQHHLVWPRPGVVGLLVGEWRPNNTFRFYEYGYEWGCRITPEILLERRVERKTPLDTTKSCFGKISDANSTETENITRLGVTSLESSRAAELGVAFCEPTKRCPPT